MVWLRCSPESRVRIMDTVFWSTDQHDMSFHLLHKDAGCGQKNCPLRTNVYLSQSNQTRPAEMSSSNNCLHQDIFVPGCYTYGNGMRYNEDAEYFSSLSLSQK